jgi:hypothetical protein
MCQDFVASRYILSIHKKNSVSRGSIKRKQYDWKIPLTPFSKGGISRVSQFLCNLGWLCYERFCFLDKFHYISGDHLYDLGIER